MEMWFQGAGTSIRWEIRETDSDSDVLLEEETGFNPKGNWNYQRALNTCSFILRDFPIAQVVKNLPATQKITVRSLGWEDPLERRKWLLTPAFLPGECHGQGSLAGYSPWGHKELDTTERLALAFILGAQQTKNFRVWWALSRKQYPKKRKRKITIQRTKNWVLGKNNCFRPPTQSMVPPPEKSSCFRKPTGGKSIRTLLLNSKRKIYVEKDQSPKAHSPGISCMNKSRKIMGLPWWPSGLRLCASNAGGTGLISARSRTKILLAATETWHNPINKYLGGEK